MRRGEARGEECTGGVVAARPPRTQQGGRPWGVRSAGGHQEPANTVPGNAGDVCRRLPGNTPG